MQAATLTLLHQHDVRLAVHRKHLHAAAARFLQRFEVQKGQMLPVKQGSSQLQLARLSDFPRNQGRPCCCPCRATAACAHPGLERRLPPLVQLLELAQHRATALLH